MMEKKQEHAAWTEFVISRQPRWQPRNYRRFDLKFAVRLKFQTGPDTAEIDGISKNVSLGGLLVRSACSIPPQTHVTFVLTVHGQHGLRPVRLVGEGEVVRTEPEQVEEGFAFAVRCNSPVSDLQDYLPS